MPRKITAAIAIFLILISVVFLMKRSTSFFQEADPGFLKSLGKGVANETAGLIQDAGEVVVVTYEDPQHPDGMNDPFYVSLLQNLKKHPRIQVGAPETFPLEVAKIPEEGGCPPAKLLEIVQRHKTAAAILFKMDLPSWNRLQSVGVPEAGAKIIVVGQLPQDRKEWYEGYFLSKTIVELILPARKAPIFSAKGESLKDSFGTEFQVIKSENFEAKLE